jgi:hypothetical protein
LARRSWHLLILWFLVAGSGICSASAFADRVTVSAERVGRVFYPGEPIRLYVTATHSRQQASYVISDYAGRTWQQGAMTIGGGTPVTLRISYPFPVGWYRFRLLIGPEVVDDAFCVIPLPCENSRGDDGLFNLQLTSTDERQYAAAAQLGIRCFRTDVPWPPIEPARGTFQLESFREQIRLCQKYGIQLMATLGYTPPWVGVGPVDGPDDWIKVSPFVWHPREMDAWCRFVGRILEEVRGVTVTWPSAEVLPEDIRYQSRQLPVVQSWELWNEADHCFYVGSWGRYLDLLRVTSCMVKDAFPRSPMIYGGATGNWVNMCVTCANRAPVYFDQMASHPDGGVDAAMTRWYQGMYQLPWIDGYPRENSLNETYLRFADTGEGYGEHQQEPGDLYRIRVQLMHWNQDNLFRSSCLHQWVAQPNDLWARNAQLLEKNGGLVPTPLYVAFAGARYWLSDAVYVGPVDLGEGTEAYVLLKKGRPLLVAWADRTAQVVVATQGHVSEISVMGQESRPSQRHVLVANLGRSPVMIWGAHPDYLEEALIARYDLFMRTQFGNDAGQTVWYGAGRLEDDLKNWANWPFKEPLDKAMAETAAWLARNEVNNETMDRVLNQLRDGMLQTVVRCQQAGQVAPRAVATIYRLAYIAEWLAAIADERNTLWSTYSTSEATLDFYRRRLEHYRRLLPSGDAEAEPAFARQMLDRADKQLQRATELGGRGAVQVATMEMWVAWELMQIENRLPHRVFFVGDFKTAVQLRKAHLLAPDATHQVTVTVYNFSSQAATGTVRMSIPDTWQPTSSLEQPFVADSKGVSESLEFSFSIPGSSSSWRRTTAGTPEGDITVELPPGLTPTADIFLRGNLDDGTELMQMLYPVCVGRLTK